MLRHAYTGKLLLLLRKNIIQVIKVIRNDLYIFDKMHFIRYLWNLDSVASKGSVLRIGIESYKHKEYPTRKPSKML